MSSISLTLISGSHATLTEKTSCRIICLVQSHFCLCFDNIQTNPLYLCCVCHTHILHRYTWRRHIYTHRCVHICLDLQRDIDMLTWVNAERAFNVSYSRETSRMLGCLAPESHFALLASNKMAGPGTTPPLGVGW